MQFCGVLLQVWEQTPGVYVPQLGDEVVYLKDGHQKYFRNINDKRRCPWDTIVSTAVCPQRLLLTGHCWILWEYSRAINTSWGGLNPCRLPVQIL